MSTKQQKSGQGKGEAPTHADVSFESTDVKTGTILAYLFYLALAVAVTFLISVLILRFTTNMAVQLETPPPPVRQGAGVTMPPEPRLQGVPGHEVDPQQDLRDKIKVDTEANKKLGWIDQKAGIAQIPVEEAMKIIARKGLLGVPVTPDGKQKVEP